MVFLRLEEGDGQMSIDEEAIYCRFCPTRPSLSFEGLRFVGEVEREGIAITVGLILLSMDFR